MSMGGDVTEAELDDLHVEDDEGFVDKQLKKRVLQKREVIDEAEEEWFTAAQLGEVSYEDALLMWHERIRTWLRTIEPLLRDDSLPNAEKVYKRKTIGAVTVEPPEDLLQTQTKPNDPRDISKIEIKEELKLREVKFCGLIDIIERQEVSATWTIKRRSEDPRDGGEDVIRRQITRPLPKWLLEDSIRIADAWLQQAGIGLSISSGDPHGMT